MLSSDKNLPQRRGHSKGQFLPHSALSVPSLLNLPPLNIRYNPYQRQKPSHPSPITVSVQSAATAPIPLMGIVSKECKRNDSKQAQQMSERVVSYDRVQRPSTATPVVSLEEYKPKAQQLVTTGTQTISEPTTTSSASHSSDNESNKTTDMSTDKNQPNEDKDNHESFDDVLNTIYYQCRYNRYANFSRANLLNEVLTLCATIDRLQCEKKEIENRIRDLNKSSYRFKERFQSKEKR